MGMAESGIDSARVRNAEQQLVNSDSGQQVALGDQPIVAGVVEIENVLEMRLVVRNAGQHAFAALAVARGDQAVGVAAADETCPRWSIFSGVDTGFRFGERAGVTGLQVPR
jgi:hypothetical protein